MSSALRRLATVLLVCGVLGGLAGQAWGLARVAPSAIRFTSGVSHTHPTTRSWGNFFAFPSTENFVGGAVSGQQIYVFNAEAYACRFGRPELDPSYCPSGADKKPFLVRATAGPGSPDHPSVNAAGTLVALDALGSFGGLGGAAAGHRQIFVQNVKTKEITTITANGSFDSIRPSANYGAGVIAFESEAPLLGGPGGVSQIFVYHVPSGRLTQVTKGAAPSRFPMLNKDGSRVVFESTADLLGDGHDTGVSQVFWFDGDWDQKTGTLFQLTRGNGPSRHAYLFEKRPGWIAFESEASNLPGTLGGPGTQIYVGPTEYGSFPSMFQETFGPGNCRWPAVDPSNFHLAFICDGDLLQNGTTGNRLFVRDIEQPGGILYQVTGRGDIQGPIAANVGLWFVTLATDNDMAATGNCGRQLYLVDYDPQHYFEPGHAREPATALGEVPLEPPPASQDDGCESFDHCSIGTCVNGSTCLRQAVADGTPCGDGDICSGDTKCMGGFCDTEAGLECDDGDPCTEDTCDPNAGGCQHNELEPIPELQCRLEQIQTSTANLSLPARILRHLTKAKARLEKARTETAKRASRDLMRARASLRKVVALVNRIVPKAERGAIVTQARDLIRQAKVVARDIRRSKSNGGGK